MPVSINATYKVQPQATAIVKGSIGYSRGTSCALNATNVYISFLEDDSLQDADAVVGIVLKNLELYKQAHTEVEQVYIKSDNAA